MKSKTKKLTSLLLALTLIFGVMSIAPFTVSAAGNSFSSPTAYSIGSKVSGSITNSNTNDYYKFTLSSSGKISLNVTSYIYYSNYYIYDSKYNQVWSKTSVRWNDTNKVITMDEEIDLTSGTYYFLISQNDGTGNYNFKMNFTSANESFKETQGGTNNSFNYASSISLNTSYYGQLAQNDGKDYYRFTLSTSGKIKINLTAYIYRSAYCIYDSKYNAVWSRTRVKWNDTTEVMTMNEEIDLTSGTYYFLVYDDSEYGVNSGNYNFKLNYTSSNESFKETQEGSNNNFNNASSISLNTNYYGQIAQNDDKDYYKFTLSGSGKVTLNVTAYLELSYYYIYDSSYNEIWTSRMELDGAERKNMSEELTLSKGTYYLLVAKWNKSTGNYSFKISNNAPTSVKLNKSSITLGVGESYTLTKTVTPSNATTSYTWSSSNTSVATVYSSGKITAKATGTANITVKTSNGKTATCKVTVKKAPSKVSLNKTSITLGVGETYDLNSSLPSGTASYSVKYSSNKTSVATVKAAGGLVTAKAVGTATITAKTYNGKTATCKVTVKKAPTSVSLNKTSITLKVGQTYDLNSKLQSGTASYSVKYTSNNTKVATVKAAGGLVTAKSKGTATITATTYNGKKATCKVTVK